MLSVYLKLNLPYFPLYNTELRKPMAVTKSAKLVKKELSKYLTEQGIEMKKQISFLGDDKDIEEKLSQKFEISENAGTLVVSKLSLKNLYNISNAIYENDYEEKKCGYPYRGKGGGDSSDRGWKRTYMSLYGKGQTLRGQGGRHPYRYGTQGLYRRAYNR